MESTREELIDAFRSLGADDPEGWANSQLSEGFRQLHRCLFLRLAWSQIPDERDTSWIQRSIDSSRRHPDQPFGGAGLALERLRAAGASDEDLTESVRAQLAEFLFHIGYVLADSSYRPAGLELSDAVVGTLDDVEWGLFALDSEGHPRGAVGALHESVLEMDPMGREVRPRPSGSS